MKIDRTGTYQANTYIWPTDRRKRTRRQQTTTRRWLARHTRGPDRRATC